MYSVWTKHLKEQSDKDDFILSVTGSKRVLDRVKEILSEEENNLDRSELDQRTFDLPNWDYRQAYKNGFRAALRFCDKLIDLDHQKETK